MGDERKLLVFVTLIIIAAAATLLEINAFRQGRESLGDQLVGSILTPVESVIARSATAIAAQANALVHAHSMSAENASLVRKTQQLASANERLQTAAAENRELKKLLGMRNSLPGPSTVADVVGYVPEAERREIVIDRGWTDGVKRDAVALSGDGLVGHVVAAGPHEARVLLIIDPTSAVPAYLRNTRSWGIVTGTWEHVKMKYIGQDVKVRLGDTVVTGRGQVYPPGIPIGQVKEVQHRQSEPYQQALLQSATDFAGLTRVLVLQKQTP